MADTESMYVTEDELIARHPDIRPGFIKHWFPSYPVPITIADELLHMTRLDGTHLTFNAAVE